MSTSSRSLRESDNLPTAIPLIVGVTGHRDLMAEDVPHIKELVRQVLRSLKAEFPHTPLVLMSPLVEGADQVVAEVALEPDMGVRLMAVLAWPLHSSTPAGSGLDDPSRGNTVRFHELLGQASNVVAMPVESQAHPFTGVGGTDFRERQCDLVGKYVARHSQLLIALWDGNVSESSQTVRVMDWQQHGAPAPFATQLGELDVVEGAPICHIRVHRQSQVAEGATPVAPIAKYLYPQLLGPLAKVQVHRTWANLDRFNRDVAELRRRQPQTVETSRSWVLPAETEARLTPALRELFEFYALADAGALSYQGRVKWLVRTLFVIGPLALVCLEIYAHLWSHWPALLGYLILLACGVVMFRVARRFEWEGRYLDTRALAEALRVQFFWRWAGLTDSAAEHYLRHLRGELGWIRQAARSCFLLTSEQQLPHLSTTAGSLEAGSDESLNGVLQHWVRDQAKFFVKKAPWNEHRESHCERIARWSFSLALILAAFELWVHWRTEHANHLLIVLTFFGLVAAALAEEVADYQMYGVLARQYEWMKNLFTTAATKLEALIAAGNVTRSQALIRDLGLEALNENADWLVQRRRKPVVLPK